MIYFRLEHRIIFALNDYDAARASRPSWRPRAFIGGILSLVLVCDSWPALAASTFASAASEAGTSAAPTVGSIALAISAAGSGSATIGAKALAPISGVASFALSAPAAELGPHTLPSAAAQSAEKFATTSEAAPGSVPIVDFPASAQVAGPATSAKALSVPAADARTTATPTSLDETTKSDAIARSDRWSRKDLPRSVWRRALALGFVGPTEGETPSAPLIDSSQAAAPQAQLAPRPASDISPEAKVVTMAELLHRKSISDIRKDIFEISLNVNWGQWLYEIAGYLDPEDAPHVLVATDDKDRINGFLLLGRGYQKADTRTAVYAGDIYIAYMAARPGIKGVGKKLFLEAARAATPFVGPDQAALEEMMASMGAAGSQ